VSKLKKLVSRGLAELDQERTANARLRSVVSEIRSKVGAGVKRTKFLDHINKVLRLKGSMSDSTDARLKQAVSEMSAAIPDEATLLRYLDTASEKLEQVSGF